MPRSTALGSGGDPLIWLGLAAATLFFVATGAVAYLNFQTLKHDSALVVRSGDTLTALEDVLSTVRDAETGQRGYLLTDKESYLGPYNAAAQEIGPRFDMLRRLTIDNPAQQDRLATLKQHIDAKLAELKQTIDLRQTQGPAAALAVVQSDRGKQDMDAIRDQVSAMEQEEIDLRAKRLAEMADAYWRAIASGIISSLLGLGLTGVVGFLIVRSEAARRREDWLQTGRVGLSKAMLGDQPINQLGDNILGYLCRYLDAHAGAAFSRDRNGPYRRMSTYGVPADAKILDHFASGDGLLGQAAVEGRSILVRDVPEGYLAIGSAFGEGKPRHLVVAPAIVDGSTNAVLEFGFVHPLNEDALSLLEQMSEGIGIAVRSANYRAELQNFLEETQRQAEELQAQGEELRVSNEELEEQGRALKESRSRLELQQAELEQTNSQLEEQAQQLENQRDDLERVNDIVRQRAQELERASQYKSDFLANMSHELRTPLNSLLILAKLLADNDTGRLSEEQVRYAQTIQSSGNDLLTLINDILDLSKIEAGHMEIKPEPLALVRLTKDLTESFRAGCREEKSGVSGRSGAGMPSLHRDRRSKARAGLAEPPVERIQVHGTGQGGVERRPRFRRPDRPIGRRHRHRHLPGQTERRVRTVQAGGRNDQPQVWRHRPRAIDLSRTRPSAWRNARAQKRGRARQHLHSPRSRNLWRSESAAARGHASSFPCPAHCRSAAAGRGARGDSKAGSTTRRRSPAAEWSTARPFDHRGRPEFRHPHEGVQRPLPAIGKDSFLFLQVSAALNRGRGSDCEDDADPRTLQRA